VPSQLAIYLKTPAAISNGCENSAMSGWRWSASVLRATPRLFWKIRFAHHSWRQVNSLTKPKIRSLRGQVFLSANEEFPDRVYDASDRQSTITIETGSDQRVFGASNANGHAGFSRGVAR